MNPKFSKFLEDHPNASLLGIGWAMSWRLSLVYIGVYIAFMIVIFGVAWAIAS